MSRTEGSYDRARGLAEKAVEEYAKGDRGSGDRLAEQAVKTDRAAVEDVVQELEQDVRTTGGTDAPAKP